MSWKTDGENLQWERDSRGDAQPRIRWNNGRKVGRAGDPGCFYMKADYVNGTPEGWTESNLFPNEEGLEAPFISLIVLGKRSQPFSQNGKFVTWHTHWQRDQGMKIYTELYCLMKGYSEPVIFTCKGWTAQRVVGAKRSVIADHEEYVVKVANAQAKKPLPAWAFWMEFGGVYDAKNQPFFTQVGDGSQSTVLHDIALKDIKAPATEEQLGALYIGHDLLVEAARIRADLLASKWQDQKRGNATAEPEQPAAPAQGATEYDDDERPF